MVRHHEIDQFTLRNDDPRPTFWKCASGEKPRQQVLFAGMDCLSGQRDLFQTDGQADNDSCDQL